MQMPWLQRNVGEGKASGCSEKSGRSITGVTFFRHRETPRQEMGWLVDTKISLLILLPKWYFRKSKSMWHCDDRAPHFLSNHEVGGGGYCKCVPDVPSIHDICHFFSTWHIFGYNFSPHKKRVNRDKTDFTVKQRKPLINWFGNKTG